MRVLSADFFGLNDVGFWGQAGRRTAAPALAQTAIRTVRFPGGDPADWYDWQQPYYRGWSSTSPLRAWQWARSFGARTMIFGTNYQGHLPDPPGKRYAVNSPENAAAWAAYNRRMGIHADMEVGNEEDITMKSAGDPAFLRYVRAFNAQARAMHRADPGVQVLGPAGTNEYYWWALNSLGTFLANAGNRTGSGQVDGVSLHWYQGKSWADSRDAAEAWLQPDGPWSAIQSAIRAHDTRHLPVYITEWNAGGSQSNRFNATLGHALVTADVLGAFAVSGVAGEDYFGLHGASSWGLLYGQGEKRPLDSPTPTYYAMVLWKHMGPRIVSVKDSGDAANLSTYAATGSGGSVQLLAINKSSQARTVTIALKGTSAVGRGLSVYSLAGAHGLISDVSARYDGVTMPSPQHPLPGPQSMGTVQTRDVTYRLRGNSAVVLSLSAPRRATAFRPQRAAGTGSLLPAAASHFTVRCRVRKAVVGAGKVEFIAVTATSSASLKGAHVDVEIYDTLNNRVFHSARTVTFTAGAPATVIERYRVAARAGLGSYTVKVGIFDAHWKHMLFWDDRAGWFNVAGRQAPEITLAANATPAFVSPGGTARIKVTVSLSYAGLSNTIVDVDVIGGGREVCHRFRQGVAIPAGHVFRFTAICPIAASATAGPYVARLGLFGPHWRPLYRWNDRAAIFTVR